MVIWFHDNDFLRETISVKAPVLWIVLLSVISVEQHTLPALKILDHALPRTLAFYHLVLKQVLRLEMIMSLKSCFGKLLLLTRICCLERDRNAQWRLNCLLKEILIHFKLQNALQILYWLMLGFVLFIFFICLKFMFKPHTIGKKKNSECCWKI